MPKFSIIIPVYNVEQYIKECLDSVFNQTFKDYEVIVVNDGTEDNSMDIVNNYDVKIINQKNSGLSAARNNGLKKATGEYILFLDSDDYLDKKLLEKISEVLDNSPDLIRYQVREVFDTDSSSKDYPEKEFNNLNGVEAFGKIAKYHFVEPASLYFIKKEFYEKKKFKFKEGTLHEDYGLIPLVIISADVVNSINYIGYNYRQRANSIMSSNNYSKVIKKVTDFYDHYNYLIKEIDKTNLDSKVFKSFISNSLILKICELKGKDYKLYKKRLIKDKVFDNLLADTFTRKVKRVIFRISPRLGKKLV